MARYTLDLTDSASEKLDQLSREGDMTKAEVLRRALALFSVAEREKRAKRYIGSFTYEDGNPKVVTEFVGI